jgi:1,2-diacylglycerol 3-alpha-glucosyltransferase
VARLKVGIVTKWFNRGQAFVSRYIRSALDELGHETFLLARPTKDKGPMAAHVERTGVWDQPGVTEASAWEVPLDEYLAWVDANGIEAVHFDNCYQHAEIAELRRRGVRTVGRFVWEMFSPEDAGHARDAYDVLYSLTRCEQQRYRELGIESPYVQWGVHPELLRYTERGSRDRAASDPLVRFYFPGALMGPRKPHKAVIEAFERTPGNNLRLVFKTQLERRAGFLRKAAERDPRIELVLDDLPTDEHMALFAGCDVCLGPSRWEGLGLFLHEATAFGMPTITNDSPPMNEVVADGDNGLLVASIPDGHAESGIPAFAPDVDELAAAIERLVDPELRDRLSAGARAARERLAWGHTVAGFAELFDRVAAVPAAEG